MSLNESAAVIHEVYLSYVTAGFTPDQAMQLIELHLQDILERAREIGKEE